MKKVILSLALLFSGAFAAETGDSASAGAAAKSGLSVRLDDLKANGAHYGCTVGAHSLAWHLAQDGDSVAKAGLRRAAAFGFVRLFETQASDVKGAINEAVEAAAAVGAVHAVDKLPYVGKAVNTAFDTVTLGYFSPKTREAVKLAAAQFATHSLRARLFPAK